MGWPRAERQTGRRDEHRGSMLSHPPTNPNRFLSNGTNLPPSKAEVHIPQDEEYGLKAKTILKVEIKK